MRPWLRRLRGISAARPAERRPHYRLALEPLEDRCLLSANVLQTNLVSDLPGVAQLQDPNLVNPWGISESGGSPFWISDNNAGVSTLYSVPGANNTPVSINSLVVSIPTPGDPTGASGAPTGTVFNIALGSGAFKVSNGTTSAPAIFLFATEDGTLVGWNPNVNPAGSDPTKAGTFATIAVDNSGNNFTEPNPLKQTGAVYKGLAIATGFNGPIFASDPNSTTVLYATNFRSGQVEVYDTQFQRVMLPAGAFSDPNLPKGYAPFNVAVLGGHVFVTYAKQDAARHDDVAGPGNGFIDEFNLDGTPAGPHLQPRLVSRGALDSPWGLAIAPSSFGSLAGALLVGNFGDGHIHAYDPSTGAFLGTLMDPDGEPIQINGLWALKVGNGGNGGLANTVYFTAGLDHESHGLFGSLTPVAPGTPEGLADAQMVQAALDVVQLDENALVKDISSGASKATIRQDIQTLKADLAQLVQAETRFALDELHDSGKAASGAARELALEALGELFAGLGDLTRDSG